MIPENIEDLSEIELAALLRPLNPHQKDILKRRLGLAGYEKQTLQEVADNIGKDVDYVRLMEVKAMVDLGWVNLVKKVENHNEAILEHPSNRSVPATE
jgi:RNA polymerase nonessential primary-like sigma factor